MAIAFTDQGCGIPENALSRIFDPFFTTKPRGTGLGLTSSYSIVRKHGGHIAVASTIGKGTTFTVWLPAMAHTNAAVVAKKGGAGADLRGSGRILVMDDEQGIRETARAVLGTAGYTVCTAKDGNDAIKKYRKALAAKKPFAAVILDITVPGGMGGEQTIANLRAINKKVIAVVSSGYAENPLIANYKAFGFAAAVPKPYRKKKRFWKPCGMF